MPPLIDQIQVLVESLPSIITMLLTGGDLDLGPFGDVADEWLESPFVDAGDDDKSKVTLMVMKITIFKIKLDLRDLDIHTQISLPYIFHLSGWC